MENKEDSKELTGEAIKVYLRIRPNKPGKSLVDFKIIEDNNQINFHVNRHKKRRAS